MTPFEQLSDELRDLYVTHMGKCGAKDVFNGMFSGEHDHVEDFIDSIYELPLEDQFRLLRGVMKIDTSLIRSRPISRWCMKHHKWSLNHASEFCRE